jgi:hypothetical protein
LGNVTFLEDYEVYISPTEGNAVANFTTLLLDVNNELSTGNFRTVSLNSYVGTSFRIAFRNNGNDQYMMFLDNIKVAAATTLSADTFSLSGVKIYPNPAKDVLNIESSTEVLTKVSITDLNGRVVKEVSNNLSQISLGNLAKGIYMVTIESATAKKVERLIVE